MKSWSYGHGNYNRSNYSPGSPVGVQAAPQYKSLAFLQPQEHSESHPSAGQGGQLTLASLCGVSIPENNLQPPLHSPLISQPPFPNVLFSNNLPFTNIQSIHLSLICVAYSLLLPRNVNFPRAEIFILFAYVFLEPRRTMPSTQIV